MSNGGGRGQLGQRSTLDRQMVEKIPNWCLLAIASQPGAKVRQAVTIPTLLYFMMKTAIEARRQCRLPKYLGT